MRRLLAILTLSLIGATPARAGGWKQFPDRDGVKGFARTVPGSDLLELRSTIMVPARIEVVGAVLRDVEGLARPGSSCTEARILEKRDRNHYTFYVAYDFPWPASDRDAVIQVNTRYDLERARVIADLRAVEDPRAPRRKHHVRITDLRSQFVIEYLSRHKTGVVYTSRADPAGHLPAFLVNRGAKSSLLQNALDLRRAVSRPEYLRAAASSTDAALVERVTRDPARMAKIVANRLGQFIRDRALIARLVSDPQVVAALMGNRDNVGEILLHGWGSPESQGRAVQLLLGKLLEGQTRDRAAINRFVSDPRLIDQALGGTGADNQVAAFLKSRAARGK